MPDMIPHIQNHQNQDAKELVLQKLIERKQEILKGPNHSMISLEKTIEERLTNILNVTHVGKKDISQNIVE